MVLLRGEFEEKEEPFCMYIHVVDSEGLKNLMLVVSRHILVFRNPPHLENPDTNTNINTQTIIVTGDLKFFF